MSLRFRIPLALVIGIAAGVLCFRGLTERGYLASDFQYPLRAGRALLAGENPYAVIEPIGEYPFESFFTYPIWAAVVAIPFAPFEDRHAGALFLGVSSALLAFVSSRGDCHRLAVFLGAPFFVCASTAQWGPFIMAATLMTAEGRALAFVKPNLGLAAFAYRPSVRTITVVLLATVVSLLLMPQWPAGWLDALLSADARYTAPLLAPGGFLILLASLRWRTPEGRLLLVSGIIPRHNYWYDGLLIWLVPSTWCQGLLLSALSWVAYLSWARLTTGLPGHISHPMAWPWQIGFIYLPALAMAFWQGRHDHSHSQ